MRSEVKNFAALMEAKLKKNDWKGGWKNESIVDMLNRLNEEVAELNQIAFESSDGLDIRDECIDVANFAMIISDLICDMGEKE